MEDITEGGGTAVLPTAVCLSLQPVLCMTLAQLILISPACPPRYSCLTTSLDLPPFNLLTRIAWGRCIRFTRSRMAHFKFKSGTSVSKLIRLTTPPPPSENSLQLHGREMQCCVGVRGCVLRKNADPMQAVHSRNASPFMAPRPNRGQQDRCN